MLQHQFLRYPIWRQLGDLDAVAPNHISRFPLIIINLAKIDNHSSLGFLLRVPLRLVPKNATMRVLQGPMRGAKWVAGSSTHGCWLGTYEKQKQMFFAEHLRAGQVCWDVGANVGFYTLMASLLVGPAGHVVAVEPLPENLEFLRRHLRLNDVDNVTVIEGAVCEFDGAIGFEPHNSPSMGKVTTHGSRRVAAVTLDTLVFEKMLPKPDLIKIDVEGAEAAVFEGGLRVFEEVCPIVVLATHGKVIHKKCLDWLDRHGYQVRGMGGAPIYETDELIAEPRGRVVKSPSAKSQEGLIADEK